MLWRFYCGSKNSHVLSEAWPLLTLSLLMQISLNSVQLNNVACFLNSSFKAGGNSGSNEQCGWLTRKLRDLLRSSATTKRSLNCQKRRLNGRGCFRALSTIQQSMVRPVQSSALVTKEQSRDFMALFPDLVRELTEVGRSQELPDVMRRFARVSPRLPHCHAIFWKKNDSCRFCNTTRPLARKIAA